MTKPRFSIFVSTCLLLGLGGCTSTNVLDTIAIGTAALAGASGNPAAGQSMLAQYEGGKAGVYVPPVQTYAAPVSSGVGPVYVPPSPVMPSGQLGGGNGGSDPCPELRTAHGEPKKC